MSQDLIKLNEVVDVELIGRQKRKPMKTKIEGVKSDSFDLAPLYEKGIQILVRPGDRLRITVAVENGCYQFDTVVRQIRQENIELIEVEQPTSIRRVQRRRMYRLEIVLPVRYRLEGENEWHPGQTANISGSGVRLVGLEGVQKGDVLDLAIDLDCHQLQLKGEIVCSGVTENEQIFWYGIRFLDISQQQQDAIVRFVFERQRQLRKQGII